MVTYQSVLSNLEEMAKATSLLQMKSVIAENLVKTYDKGKVRALAFEEGSCNIVCTWHGYEYDLKTGECIGDRKLKLRKFDVIERGGDVYVVA